MINFIVGKKSDGSIISQDLCILPNLFVSYETNPEFEKFTTSIISQNNITINECLLIAKRNDITSLNVKMETFIYNDPELGSIKNINKLFTAPYKTFKKTINKKEGHYKTLIIIDDIWQIVPKLKKGSAIQFKQLINDGADKGIHFIIGSSMPYRNLLLQLMENRKEENKSGVINQIGAEMIFNPDGLIFFRERNDINFNTYYP